MLYIVIIVNDELNSIAQSARRIIRYIILYVNNYYRRCGEGILCTHIIYIIRLYRSLHMANKRTQTIGENRIYGPTVDARASS